MNVRIADGYEPEDRVLCIACARADGYDATIWEPEHVRACDACRRLPEAAPAARRESMSETTTEEWEVIHTYTRAEAIADGMLCDVTEWASAETGFLGGFRCPVAVTAAAWHAIEAIPPALEGVADVRGRAHDVLYLASLALRGAMARDESRARFRVILPRAGERGRYVTLLVDASAGDDGGAVVTIGFPEDF